MPNSAPTARIFVFVYAALMLLLALTAVAARAPLGAWQAPVALAIAAAKMLLVFLFFMQLRYQGGLVRIFAVASFFWLGIIGVLTFSDYLTRGWLIG
ncbi:MAG TPA: cytochrome C oxidase subunit IV family protein [Opitutaceae bacterium]|nr:cytochrome C oxidase subunit IV family protein [Opitutaceae bacterium]